ncbi:MAG: hypothetical protein IJZ55_05355 [Lachnospiraceae bacterium]|nr:hypothetical protein [Lachnospiraceae bacterium]
MSEAKRKLALGIRIALFVVLFITVFVYRIIYFEMVEKRDAIHEENAGLMARVEELEGKVAKQGEYEKKIAEAEAELLQVLGKYGAGNTPEKSIMFVREMEEELDMEIPNVSFSTPSVVTSVDLSGMGTEQAWGRVDILSEQLSLSYTCGYEQWKEMFEFMLNYPERRTVRSVNASYNSETGLLSGSLVVDLYAVAGGKKEYVAPETGDISLGVDCIFPE